MWLFGVHTCGLKTHFPTGIIIHVLTTVHIHVALNSDTGLPTSALTTVYSE